MRNGKLVYARGYGLRNVDDRIRAEASTVFRVGSITKQFTAASIMLLQERGLLRVDDRVSKYLPKAPFADKVTIRNLLTHTSGIPNFYGDAVDSGAIRKPVTPDRVVAFVAKRRLEFVPGSKWSYSNTNYTLLAMIIEKISGHNYNDFVTANLFVPLNLKSARFWNNTDVREDTARGYTAYALGHLTHANYQDPTWFVGGGGLSMNAPDLARWEHDLYSGKAVSPESFKEMSTPQRLSSGKTTDYGFGLEIRKYLGNTFLSHGGQLAGFSCREYSMPRDQVVVVLLTNGEYFDQMPVMRPMIARVYGVSPVRFPLKVRKVPQEITDKARRIVEETLDVNIDQSLITPEVLAFMKRHASDLKSLRRRAGSLQSLTPIGVDKGPRFSQYAYRCVFKNFSLVCAFYIDEKSGLEDGITFWHAYDT